MLKTALPPTSSPLSLSLGASEVDSEHLAAEATRVMGAISADSPVEEIQKGVDLLATAAALGVKVGDIFRWADALYKKAAAHCKKEAALYERTNELRMRMNERYGSRSMFLQKRERKFAAITDAIHARLNQKSRERALASYVIGVAYMKMGAINNAVILGFSRACGHPDVAQWIEGKARDLERMRNKTDSQKMMQAAMATGFLSNTKPDSLQEQTGIALVNGYEVLLKPSLTGGYPCVLQ